MLGLDMGMLPWLVSAQYCVRQGASAYLELWAFVVLLVAAAILTRSISRVVTGTLVAFAMLSGILAVSMFYSCSMAAPSEQGLGTDMAAGIYTTLRCLGWDVFGTATGWTVTAILCIGAIVVFTLARVRWKRAGRILGFTASALLAILTFASAFLVFFGFSWCTSSRLF